MDRMTLREAAERASRSVTTLRRYIRSGRLHAEKAPGRYGPEYFVSSEDLAAAGLRAEPLQSLAPRTGTSLVPMEQALRELVPMTLYHELQLKHEQLLVQYGMVRVGGLRVLELQGELESARERVTQREAEIAALAEQSSRDLAAARKKLREAELEIEGRSLEIAALKEKVNGLERIAGSRTTTTEIESQLSEVADQILRVERLESRPPAPSSVPLPWTKRRGDEPEH